MDAATGIEAEVCRDIAERQQKGVRRYGVTVANAKLPLHAWLRHAYEEALDMAVYLKRAMANVTEPKPEGAGGAREGAGRPRRKQAIPKMFKRSGPAVLEELDEWMRSQPEFTTDQMSEMGFHGLTIRSALSWRDGCLDKLSPSRYRWNERAIEALGERLKFQRPGEKPPDAPAASVPPPVAVAPGVAAKRRVQVSDADDAAPVAPAAAPSANDNRGRMRTILAKLFHVEKDLMSALDVGEWLATHHSREFPPGTATRLEMIAVLNELAGEGAIQKLGLGMGAIYRTNRK